MVNKVGFLKEIFIDMMVPLSTIKMATKHGMSMVYHIDWMALR
jgi:hypothetical protein